MEPTRLTRREVLRYFSAAGAVMAGGSVPASAQSPAAKGYGSDPNLGKIYQPGDVWPLTFTAAQKKAASALADVLFPADHLGPAASALRVTDYLDEWVSAPYPLMQADRTPVLDGLAWLDAESQRRFARDFAALAAAQQQAVCDDICWPEDAKPAFAKAAAFFVLFRGLCAAAYYGTPDGWHALGFVGNIPLPSFDGPPKEVLEKLGLEQTVK